MDFDPTLVVHLGNIHVAQQAGAKKGMTTKINEIMPMETIWVWRVSSKQRIDALARTDEPLSPGCDEGQHGRDDNG